MLDQTLLLKKVGFFAVLAVVATTCAVAPRLACGRAYSAWRSTPIPIHYTLLSAGQVSLNIYNADGQVVRELLHAAPRSKGPVTEIWDGLDQNGKAAPAGSYHWKLLETQGLRSRYLMTLGTNTTPSWAPWPGNHGAVVSVTTDAGGMYVADSCGEGTPLLVKQTLEGKRLWTIPNWLDAWQGFMSMASDGGTLYGLTPGAGKIYRYDANTGKQLGVWQTNELKSANRLSVRGDQVVVCDTAAGLVRWLDPKTGASIDEAAVPGVTDVKIDANGAVLAVAGGQVVSLTRDAKTPRTLIDKSELISPLWLAIDPGTGDIFVAENSHRAVDNSIPSPDSPLTSGNQVKRFSANGKLLRTYGTPGGRQQQGIYDPYGFAGIYDISTDGRGGFIVTEPAAAPRRTAWFDANGKLMHEWYGGQMYANFAYADPDDPTTVWMDSQWGELIEAKVNYTDASWKVYATYTFSGLADGMINGTYHGGGRWFVRHRDGEVYLVRAGSNFQVVRVDEKDRKLVPVMAAISNIPHDWGWSNKPPGRMPIMEGLRKDPANQNSVLWFDLNGDGKVQANEFRFYKTADDLKNSVLADTFADDPNGAADKARVTDFFEWALGGAPDFYVFDPKITYDPAPAFHGGDNRSDRTVFMDSAGNRYAAYNTDSDRRFGAGGWASANGGNHVMKWDKAGKLQWVVGEHAAGSQAKPGEAQYFWGIAGVTHGCVVVSDCANSYEHVWDKDGLWVGRLLDNPDLTVAPKEAYQLCGENFGTSLYTNPATGNVLFFGGTQNSTNVYRIDGWDNWRRDTGNISISPAQAASIISRVTEDATSPKVAHIAYTLKPIKLNGDLSQFTAATPLIIKDGNEIRAKVYLVWNGQDIYAAYDVNTDTPWKSAAVSRDLSFQGGAAVDLNFGPMDGPGGEGRKLPAAGDMRVVASPARGGMLTLFEPVAADANSIGTPVTYETGQGKVTFQAVIGLPNPYKGPRMPKLNGPEADMSTTGYIVMFALPRNPSISLRPGERFRFDASVILANPVGDHSFARLPWHSTDPADKMTQDTYTEAVLRPQNWGIAVLE